MAPRRPSFISRHRDMCDRARAPFLRPCSFTRFGPPRGLRPPTRPCTRMIPSPGPEMRCVPGLRRWRTDAPPLAARGRRRPSGPDPCTRTYASRCKASSRLRASGGIVVVLISTVAKSAGGDGARAHQSDSVRRRTGCSNGSQSSKRLCADRCRLAGKLRWAVRSTESRESNSTTSKAGNAEPVR